MTRYNMGLDIGSTTIKIVMMQDSNVLFRLYRRHHSDIRGELANCFREVAACFPDVEAAVMVTGSGGLSATQWLGIDFIQEVIAETVAVDRFYPLTDVIIELGGEDAKITYLKPVLEQRMNGTCAGGTGAFIDQMAALLQTDAAGLNELASRHRSIYPIASRCGVFAKSDLQPLINDGAPREDLAASVLQSVVNQTVAGLACGRKIRGHIVFLGGPLAFLPELRKSFETTLGDDALSFTTPDDAQVYVAVGAAIAAGEKASIRPVRLQSLADRLEALKAGEREIASARVLFPTKEEELQFYERHRVKTAARADMATLTGRCYLGVDAGSTTTKAVLINEKNEIIYDYYAGNKGNPIASALEILRDIYSKLPQGAAIANSCVTGYGENLIRTALHIDEGEIETMAHYKAASHFCPQVDFILDIGGQDMKCMRIRNGTLDSILLNEACSSGCGSFIQTFAEALGMDAASFSREGLHAKNPVDLGTRCTVFMNSKVKQAQKEGATIGDISAGLSYSVVRNALFKVIKIKNPASLGKNIVVQGGTFYNDAILRCFELISGREVIRPDIAGLMGAFGAAILAAERSDPSRARSSLLGPKEAESFSMESRPIRCGRCGNNCKMTLTKFADGAKYLSGNRCERGSGEERRAGDLPNLFEYKYQRLFRYEPLPAEKAPRGEIGIPRALNLYENYPLWFTILTELGYRVILSRFSDHQLFQSGMDTISSESLCYPAKLTHGHIDDLLSRGVKTIFYPCIPYEQKENAGANNCFNCPIVTSYPEVVGNNMDRIRTENIRFLKPFLPLDHPRKLAKQFAGMLAEDGVTEKEAYAAIVKGYKEYCAFKEEIAEKGRETVVWLEKNNRKGIVLAGRPYHLDVEINHGIPEMIHALGFAVLTEDSVVKAGTLERPIRIVDQWAYHTRLYEAAAIVTKTPCLELVQLTSFGCGLDAVTSDQVQEILEAKGKVYTLLKIDEVSNLGAAKIRMRSLKVALQEREANRLVPAVKRDYTLKRVVFTGETKKKHTIIAPQMSPVHFHLLEAVFRAYDYDVKILEKTTQEDIQAGLQYVNNDACYPSIIVVGQIVNAFLQKKYDPDNTSVFITQTGGGCRATNYTAFLRKALADAGFPQVPVVALSVTGIEKNPGFSVGLPMLDAALKALVYGDLLQTVLLRVRPYEKVEGSANALYRRWLDRCYASLLGRRNAARYGVSPEQDAPAGFQRKIDAIIRDFDRLPLREQKRKPRVGIVGEILVKFHPDANNNAVGVIEQEGCEAVVPGLIDFFLYCFQNSQFKHEELGTSAAAAAAATAGIAFMDRYRKYMRRRLAETQKFMPPAPFYDLTEYAKTILSLGNSCGEGWFLTAEMVELIRHGVPNIICMQPFACLPNHVTGKGMIKELRRQYPQSNIVPIDYDPGASEVNQLNRIKLMISSAFAGEKRNERHTEPTSI